MGKTKLHPGAKWMFRLSSYSVGLFIAIWIGIFLGGVLSSFIGTTGIVLSILFIVIITIAIGEIYTQMAYNRWFYEFTDSELKIERGIIWKKYSNIPYERIQNVDVTRGIIARMFGFSTVNIQTAGYSAMYRSGARSEGYLPAVSIEKAEKIRDFLMKKITGKKTGGL